MDSALKEPLLPRKGPPPLHLAFAKFYVLFAGVAGLIFGTTNFCQDYSMQALTSSYRVFCLQGFGLLVYFLVLHAYYGVALLRDKGSLWTKADSSYFVQEGGEWVFDWHLARLMVCRYCLSVSGTGLTLLIFMTAGHAGMSSAVMISLLSATSVMASILFYLIFNEKLHREHAVGILLMILSVTLIANEKSRQPEETVVVPLATVQYQGGSVYIPIALGLLCSLVYSCSSIIARLASKRKVPTLQYSADSTVFTACLTIILFLVEHAQRPFTWAEAWPAVFGSFLIIFASITLNIALAYGKAGPTQAMTMLQCPWQLALETATISHQLPGFLGLSGMACGIAGAFVLIFWKTAPV